MERLKGQTILVGKEPGQGRLLVAISGTGKTAAIGSPGSVPSCVSRCKPGENIAHAKITIDKSGNITLSNMKPQNVTYVNGSEIVSKRISASNSIELGRDRFSVNLPVIIDAAKRIISAPVEDETIGINRNLGTIERPTPPDRKAVGTFNIAHLQYVWDDYEHEMDRIAQQQLEIGKKRMLPIMVSSASGVLSALGAVISLSSLWVTLPVAGVVSILYFRNYSSKDTSYADRKKATNEFQERYICPNPECGKFLGNYSYKLLKKQYSMHCPHCKCNYIEQ